MKRIISILLSVIMVVTMIPTISLAADTVKLEISINPYGNTADSIDTINWQKINCQYYLFLPADCDMTQLTVYHNSETPVTVNGREIISGNVTDIFANIGKYTVKCGKASYDMVIMQSAKIAAMYIETDKPLSYIHENKENKSSATIRTYQDGKLTLDSELKQIKGRGNSTWGYPKKPYNIKFDDKTALLGMPKAKKWSLLASYLDPSSIKNPIAWKLSNKLELSYASEYRFVDLYINCDYYGTYIVCESVEVGTNRVKINDLEKATEKVNPGEDLDSFPVGGTGPDDLPDSGFTIPSAKWVNIPNNPEDISGGYLIECEYPGRRNDEICAFVTTRGQLMTLKAPEYASKEQVEYIRNYWQAAEDAICSPDGINPDTGHHYSDYYDISSLVNMYIIQELSGNLDAGISSTYFYKDTNGKIVAGPIWDFDYAFGNFSMRGDILTNDPTMWIANRMNYSVTQSLPTDDEYPTIFNRLYRHEDFRIAVKNRWQELKDILNENSIQELIDELSEETRASSIMNGIRWSQLFTEKGFASSVGMTRAYLSDRIKNLNRGFGENAAQLYYEPNGGTGWTIETKIMVNGNIATVNAPYSTNFAALLNISELKDIQTALQSPITPPEGKKFIGWNTAPDGTGTSYQPGEKIIMNGTTILYAQWASDSGQDSGTPAEKCKSKSTLIPLRPIHHMLDSLKNVLHSFNKFWLKIKFNK